VFCELEINKYLNACSDIVMKSLNHEADSKWQPLKKKINTIAAKLAPMDLKMVQVVVIVTADAKERV
jgi:hypothetical protein